MSDAAFGKRLSWGIESLLLELWLILMGLLPVDRASAFGAVVGRVLGPLIPAHRRARRGLELAFPERNPSEREAILRKMWDHLGRTAAEYPHLKEITDPASGRVEWVGSEPSRALNEAKQACILVSGHFANWEVIAMTLWQHGLDMTTVARDPNNPYVSRRLKELRSVAGGGLTSKGSEGAREAISVLRKGRVLGLLVDQRANDGIAVPFFGREAMTTPAPAQLGLRFGCPIIPFRLERLEGARFRLTAFDELDHPDSGDKHADALAVMTEINRIYADWIADKPEDWLWVHRRWPKVLYQDPIDSK